MKSLLKTLLDLAVDYQWTLLLSTLFTKKNNQKD